MDKSNCRGCRDDFYNHRGGCWLFAKAKMVKRWKIHRDAPMGDRANFTRVTVPDCYSDSCTPKQFYYYEHLPEHLGGDKA